MKISSGISFRRLPVMVAIGTVLAGGGTLSGRAASATWLAAPFNNNWIAAPTTNNWSTGAGTFPGATSGTSSADIATFSAASSIATVNCASAFVIGGIVFDTASASAYTINTSVGTWRVVGSGIRVTGTVVNRQTITGSLRMATGGTLNVISDAATPSATLNITTGIAVNNTVSTGSTLILGGTNTGPNILGTYTENTSANAIGNLIKTNSGTWILTGNSTYHSNTFVLGGTLMLMGNGAIPNSPVITVNGGTLNVSNTMTSANAMFVTNSGALALTNTSVSQSPLTIGTLTASNAIFHLGINGSFPFTDITVTSALNAGPNITLAIDKVVSLTSAATFTLISYAGTDPDPTSFTVTVPAGYSAGAVTVGGGAVSVTITPPASTSLVWVGATNAVLVSNWDTNKTKNWVDAATMSIKQFYANPDSVQFDDTASNSVVTLITTNTPNSLTVNNNTLNYTFNGGGKISGSTSLNKQGSASLTLAGTGGDDFSGGIAVNNGTVILDHTNSAISGGLTIANGAAVQIGNNDGGGNLPAGALDDEGTLIVKRADNFTISTSISGAGALTQSGSGTLTLSVSNGYIGTTTVSKGKLALTTGNAISASSGLLVSNATFDVSGVSGTTGLSDFSLTNATLNLAAPASLQAPIAVNTFESDGTAGKSNVINVLSLPDIAYYPSTITLVKSTNAITLTGGNFNFALGSLPTASPGFAGHLSESGDSTSILLTLTAGPIGQRSTVNWDGTNYISATTNWSDSLNWQLPGTPGAADNVVFGNNGSGADASTVNNVVDFNATVASLTYNQNGSGVFHVTDIPTGTTLTASGGVTVGGLPAADGTLTQTYLTGGGTFVANGSFSVIDFGSSSSSSLATLDLSGLGTFVYNNSLGTMNIANSTSGNRFGGLLRLAGVSNNVTAATINFMQNNVSNGGNSASGIQFGSGTNVINVGTFNIVGGKNSGTVRFITGAPASAGLRIRGVNGNSDDTSRANIAIAVRNSTGTGTTTGNLSLNGNPVDIKAASLTLGQDTQSGGNGANGTLSFDTGVVDVTTIVMGIAGNAAVTGATGTINVGANATLLVGAGGLSLVNQTAGVGTGNLNIAGGKVICSNSIIKTTATGTANISLADGTLNLVAGTVGTLAAPIDTLTLSDSGALAAKIQLNVVVGATNICAAAVSASGVTTINISAFAGLAGTTQIPLISYNNGSSPIAGLALGTTPAGYTIGNGGALIDNTANQSIDIIVTPPAPIAWVGAVGSTLNSAWNTSTLNWLNGATPTAYADGDYVVFNDTASNNIVTLATTVFPTGLDVNNSVLNYTFSGSGRISGIVSLVKQGSASLILDNSGTNDFSNGVNIVGGTLQIGNNDANGNLPATGGVIDNGNLAFKRIDSNTVANVISGTGTVTQNGTGTNKLAAVNTYNGTTLISAGMIIATNATAGFSSIGSTAGACVITNGGTLDIENPTTSVLSFTNTSDTGGKQFYIAGAGVGGNGAIVNNGTASQLNALQNLTLTANATVGGPARWDMRVPDGRYAPILDLGGFTLTKTGSNQMSMVGLIVTNGGNIIINSGIFSFETTSSNATTHITVNAGGVMGHYREAAGFFTAPITLNGGMIRDLNGTPGSTNDSPITLTDNSYLDLNVGSTDLVRLNGIISESGGSFGLTKTNVGSYSLAGVNTYSGTTLVAQGTLILVDDGSIAQSKLINIAVGGTFDASQRTDQTLALAAGQTLSGFGTVLGTAATVSGSTVAPGSPTSIGTLTFANSPTLAGTNLMKLDRTAGATNDMLSVNGALVEGGTLTISLLGGTFAAGDTFTLFKATGGITGSFTVTNLPVIPGLGWVTTNLANGVLSLVVTVNPNPTNIIASLNGNVLTLSWPDHTGWILQAQTNSPGAGLSANWADVVGSSSSGTNIITVNPANPTVFYRLRRPF